MTLYLANAFSVTMLDKVPAKIRVSKVSLFLVRAFLETGFVSVVSHKGTAQVLSEILGFKVPFNRITLKLREEDVLILFQLVGARLPEGRVLTDDELKALQYDFYVIFQIEEDE